MRPGPLGAACKRFLDITGALCALGVLWPLMLALALAVRITMGSPILFRQVRPGLRERPFTLLKFRTMRESQSVEFDPSTDAARLTKIGNLLRRLSLDELPQLWNVLTGEMSLVGPRPLLMEYLAYYTPDQAKRHLMKPGITGLAQVKGRNAITWEEKFHWDVWYVDHWSVSLDLRILLATIGKVIRREGISQQGHATMEKFGSRPQVNGRASKRSAIVYGASGHGKVVADILQACGMDVEGFVDDTPKVCHLKILGDGRWLADQAARRPLTVALGIGDNLDRRTIAEQLVVSNVRLLTAVHPSAMIAASAKISPGVVIMAQAVVNADAVVGRGAIINTGAIVEHDCRVGSYAHLSPKTAIGGHVEIGDLAWLGIGTSVIPNLKIGEGSIIGAGATVIDDIEEWVVAVGTPARTLKQLARVG